MADISYSQKPIDTNHFADLLGRFFQVRDDYQNLTSTEVDTLVQQIL